MGFTILQNIYSEKAKQLEINNFPGVDLDKDPCLTYEYIINNLNLLHWFCIKPILEAFGPHEQGDFSSLYGENTSWVHISYIEGNNPRTSSLSSKREDIHEMYEGEKTLRLGDYTHNITIAEQRLI